jgi:hypothetical protein
MSLINLTHRKKVGKQTIGKMVNDKDLQIVRQSQLKLVLEYTSHAQVQLKLKEIVGITNVMVDYCINGYSKELGDRLNGIDVFISARKKSFPDDANEEE